MSKNAVLPFILCCESAFYLFLILFKPCRYIPNEVVSFYTAEITILTNRVCEVFLVTFKRIKFSTLSRHTYLFLPYFSANAMASNTCPIPELYDARTKFIRSSWGIAEKLLVVAAIYFVAALILSSASCSFPGGSPMARAVAGINCINPFAPAHETAVVSKLDSV